MKRILPIFLALAMLLALCACGGAAAAPETTAAPDVTAEPPSTVPDPPPAPEKNGLYDLLCGLMDNYHDGTAGSSLKAAWYAASITDWAAKNPGEPVKAGAMAWDRPMDNEFGETLKEKLDTVYSAALMLTADKGVLYDCGYEGDWDYTARNVKSAFEAIYPALELPTPINALIWYPSNDAERFLTTVAEMPEMSPAALSNAMQGWCLQHGSALLSVQEDGNKAIRADMNAAFASQVTSMGTAGEYMTIGAVVNTLLDAYFADTVTITVEGRPLETGHDVYDYPLERYGNNTAGYGAAGTAEEGRVIVEFKLDSQDYYDETTGEELFIWANSTPSVTIAGREGAQDLINQRLQELSASFENGAPGDGYVGREDVLQAARDEVAWRQQEGLEPMFGPFEMTRTTSVERADSRILCLTESDYYFSGGVHGSYAVFGSTFDTVTGNELQLEDLSNRPAEFPAVCLELLQAKADALQASALQENYQVLYDNYREYLPSLLRYQNWYLNDDGLVILANPYEIAPYASGLQEFTLFYSELEAYLKPEYMPEAKTGGEGTLSIAFADSAAGGLMVDLGTGGSGQPVVLTAAGDVRDLKIRSVSFNMYESGVYLRDDNTVWYTDKLADGENVTVLTWIPDVLPSVAVEWQENGETQRLYIFQSGKDGSLILMTAEDLGLPNW